MSAHGGVGPVLVAGVQTTAIIAALRDDNPDIVIVDRGAYLRVLTPKRCVLLRSSAERHLGYTFAFPEDLEAIMPSFKGQLSLDAEGASWT